MTGEEQKKLIEMVCERLDKTYIYPENVGRIRSELLKKLEAGAYRTSASPAGFAFQLDKDLQALTNDKHIGIVFNPEQAADLASEPSGDYYTPAVIDGLKETNFEFRNLGILEGNVGYLDLREFCPLAYAGETAVAAMGFLANCRAVIIDLRANGGGATRWSIFFSAILFPLAWSWRQATTARTTATIKRPPCLLFPGKGCPTCRCTS